MDDDFIEIYPDALDGVRCAALIEHFEMSGQATRGHTASGVDLSHKDSWDICIDDHVEWGEAVGMAIVPRDGHEAPGEDEIKELVRSRLRSSRVPEKIAYVDELPYNEMGKLLRRKVKDILAD